MWIARDKDGILNLHVIKPFRDYDKWCTSGYEPELKYYIQNEGYLMPTFVRIPDDLFPQFKDLSWEDEPVEVVIHERFPVHKATCPKCNTIFKYTGKDVEITTNENPWEAGYIEQEEWVKCPECGKYVRVF